jgi:hypothetical protein
MISVALVTLPAPAMAQFDTEPTNGTAGGADVLTLLPGTAISNVAGLGGGGNDVDFYSSFLLTGDVLLGMTTSLADLPISFDVPDTVAGVFSAGVLQTYNDDDGGDEFPLSSGFGSLFRYLSPGSGTYHIGVTGTGDEEFDGDASGLGHAESGRYALTVGRVNPAVPGGGFLDTEPVNDGFPGQTFPPFTFPTSNCVGPCVPDVIPLNAFGAAVAVSELLEFDIDFYELELSAGQVLSAMTAPLADLSSTFDAPDTVLALFDSAGNKLVENDDAGNEGEHSDPDLASDNPFDSGGIFGSALRALIPANGKYYLGVTGFSDADFRGSHGESGRYALLVGVAVPEPAAIVLLSVGVAGILGLTKRRRRPFVSYLSFCEGYGHENRTESSRRIHDG